MAVYPLRIITGSRIKFTAQEIYRCGNSTCIRRERISTFNRDLNGITELSENSNQS